MIKKALLALIGLQFCAVSSAQNNANIATTTKDKTFYAEAYGAKAGDSADDKTAIQNAINAAETAGGGVVQLGRGVYEIRPLATGFGLLIPNNVTLRGYGPVTIVRGMTANSSTAAFCVIANKNYTSATTDYSAHRLRVEDLQVEADVTTGGNASNCHSLIGVGHAPGAEIRRVTFNGCYYHAIEFNRCGALYDQCVVEDCRFTGSYNQSMPVELDGGGALGSGAGAVSTTPRTKVVRNIFFNRCRFERRPSSDICSSGTAVLLTHNAADQLENCVFRDCYFAGITQDSLTATCPVICVDIVLSKVQSLTIEGCTFEGFNRTQNYMIYLPTDASTEILDGITIRNNTFIGRFKEAIFVGAAAGDTTATLHNTRRGIRIENNTFAPTMAMNAYDSGLATAGASGSITDSSKSWTTNFFANGTVSIVAGTGIGQTKTITSNTATALTISGTFSPVPDTTSYYRIDRQYGAALTTGTLTGTPTTTSAADSLRTWVANELVGFSLTMTSGTQNGQSRQISANTTTALTVSAFPGAPAAGDTYRIDALPKHYLIHLAACQDVVVQGNRATYPADHTGIATPGTHQGIVAATCRNATVSGNHLHYLHTPAQLAAGTGGYFVPYTADLTKLETNSLVSTFTAVGNSLECGTSAVWLMWYEPTNGDSRSASWTYVTGLVANNIITAGTTSSGTPHFWQRHNLSSPQLNSAQSAPTIASKDTIAPVTRVVFVSGVTTINTITALSTGANGLGNQIVLIPTGLWATDTSGNIAIASTAVVSKALIMTYDEVTAKWYPSY